MALGRILRENRLARGMTASQVAANINLTEGIVESLENEDFRKIAAPIYGRGFIRLYAELLELDPAPLLKDYAELIRCKPIAPLPKRVSKPLLPPKPEQSPVERGSEVASVSASEGVAPVGDGAPEKVEQPVASEAVAEDVLELKGGELPPEPLPSEQSTADESQGGARDQSPPIPLRRGLSRAELFTRDKSKPLFSAYTPLEERPSVATEPKKGCARGVSMWSRVSEWRQSVLGGCRKIVAIGLACGRGLVGSLKGRLSPIQWRGVQIAAGLVGLVVAVLFLRALLPSPEPAPAADADDEIVDIPAEPEVSDGLAGVPEVSVPALPPAYID